MITFTHYDYLPGMRECREPPPSASLQYMASITPRAARLTILPPLHAYKALPSRRRRVNLLRVTCAQPPPKAGDIDAVTRAAFPRFRRHGVNRMISRHALGPHVREASFLRLHERR